MEHRPSAVLQLSDDGNGSVQCVLLHVQHAVDGVQLVNNICDLEHQIDFFVLLRQCILEINLCQVVLELAKKEGLSLGLG